MKSRCIGFLIALCLSAALPARGQSIIQGAPAPSAPVQAVPPSPSAPIQPGSQNGGDFSNVTQPDPATVVPKETIIVKGAWSSASDSKTPTPEGNTLAKNVFTNEYFGLSYVLPPDFVQKFTPPPPSETGNYVLAQM